jgi:Recombination endonuclease VII
MSSRSDRARQRYAEDPEYREWILASQRKYRLAHAEKVRARDRAAQRDKRFKSYGITAADYDAMFARQGGACAICERTDQKLCVDHDHDTGLVGLLLCNNCNAALGFCSDDPRVTRASAEYLEEHGALFRREGRRRPVGTSRSGSARRKRGPKSAPRGGGKRPARAGAKSEPRSLDQLVRANKKR